MIEVKHCSIILLFKIELYQPTSFVYILQLSQSLAEKTKLHPADSINYKVPSGTLDDVSALKMILLPSLVLIALVSADPAWDKAQKLTSQVHCISLSEYISKHQLDVQLGKVLDSQWSWMVQFLISFTYLFLIIATT